MNTRINPTATLAMALLAAIALAGCKKTEDETATMPPAATTVPAPVESMPPAMSTAMPPAGTTGMPPASTTVGMATGPGGTTAEATSMDATGPITDAQFYADALTGGEKEIAASKMAEKSGNAQVKALAKAIIADHTALGDKVKAAAGANAPTPAAPDLSALTGKTGNDLDKAYVDMMVADHQQDIPVFENASKNASTDTAKQLATAALPKLHKHLDMAQKAQSS
ncbi:MAG TPA: DUF4142 domain-containing protein, partial [Xanthomonadaceae bacterium]|nr:DUF4142 domain-containing protein [Xanthomonadaceae bacterium]